jgi:hypothetical protein
MCKNNVALQLAHKIVFNDFVAYKFPVLFI